MSTSQATPVSLDQIDSQKPWCILRQACSLGLNAMLGHWLQKVRRTSEKSCSWVLGFTHEPCHPWIFTDFAESKTQFWSKHYAAMHPLLIDIRHLQKDNELQVTNPTRDSKGLWTCAMWWHFPSLPHCCSECQAKQVWIKLSVQSFEKSNNKAM